MYLARVEMTGFKSFADKTVIEFDQGMTAVVGPNGSGKSNLSEAIRWVLGEQSAKSLRGSKMEDVIFNGTADRKAVNLAKVTLVLNNEDRYLDYDFSEISITRSYNRNGESNYYINNESVRLKDIVDLLLDSGLGKNSFAMISQGKVESIFLNKPEERRAIFEEAAGVQKYQYRKIEAERKLTKSSDHLSRVKDIIHELEGQLKPLKKQRERAIKYQELKAVLSKLEVSLYTHQIRQNRDLWEKAKFDLQQIEEVLTLNETNLQKAVLTISDTQDQLEQLIHEIDLGTEEYQNFGTKLEQLKAKLQMKQQELQFNQTTQQDKSILFEQQLQQQAITAEQLEKIQLELETLTVQLTQHKEELSRLEEERHVVSGLSEDEVEQLRNQMIEYYQREASAKNDIVQLRNQIAHQEANLERTNSRRNSFTTSSQDLESQKLQIESELLANRQSRQEQLTVHQNLAQQWQAHQQQKETMQKAIFDNEREINRLSVRVQSLEQMQDQYEGYYGGVKAVMKNAKQLSGIEGTVAELISVTPEYQVAIDTALGGALQHIVVKDDHAARQAIQYLKEQRAGRATFLPRPNIKERVLNEHFLNTAKRASGFVGIASDIVTHHDKDTVIIRHLLGLTIVMDKTDNAQALAKELKHQVRIVTLDGDILMPGGSISGGRQKTQTATMLSRQSELETAKQQLIEIQAQQQEYEKSWQAIQTEESILRKEGEESRERLNQSEVKLQQTQNELQQIELQIQNAEKEQKIFGHELSEAQNLLETARERLVTAEKIAEEMSQKIANGNLMLAQLNENQADRQEKLDALNVKINAVMTDIAVAEMAIKQHKGQQLQYRSQLEDINALIKQYEAHDQVSTQSAELLTEQIVLLEKEISELSPILIQKHEQLDKLRTQRTELNQSIRDLEEKQRQIQSQQQQNYQKQAKLQASVEKYEELIDNHLNFLSENYQLSFEAAEREAESSETDMSEAKNQVKALRHEIEALGPINLSAIEDYEALDERYGYLTEQQDDLMAAMEQLQDTMNEMDAEVIKRFSEAFHQINHQFKRTFKRLFGGGEAALELTDPNDLLTTGVDIIAQPPGKRKQNLALLSGGERAFTAIALLFAILETKPVPFCILDEVEAALDDANVWRYGEYLQHFTENTQFIVITHRKGTMEHADVLYGVTMERSGVSKLASVRLSEAKV